MQYLIRINHHSAERAPLLIDGLRPVLLRAAQNDAALQFAFAPHWLHGPHVLVGIAGNEAAVDSAADDIVGAIADWMAGETPCAPIDRAAYEERSRRLATAEGLDFTPQDLRQDLTVERGKYALPLPFGDERLAKLRDEFRSASLWTVFEIVAHRRASLTDALVRYASLFMALEHVRWQGHNPWPLSPQGQAAAAGKLFAGSDFDARVTKFAQILFEEVQARDLLGSPDALVADVTMLQAAYDAVLAFALENRHQVVSWANEQPAATEGPNGMDGARWLAIISNPLHFAYRFVANHLYDMSPLAGFSVAHRLLVCSSLSRLIETNFPQITARTAQAGSAF